MFIYYIYIGTYKADPKKFGAKGDVMEEEEDMLYILYSDSTKPKCYFGK